MPKQFEGYPTGVIKATANDGSPYDSQRRAGRGAGSGGPYSRLLSIVGQEEEFQPVTLYMTWARIAAGIENKETGFEEVTEYVGGLGKAWLNASGYVDQLIEIDSRLAFELGLFLTLLPVSEDEKVERFNRWVRGDGPILLAKPRMIQYLLSYLTSNGGYDLAETLLKYMDYDFSSVDSDTIFDDPSCFLAVAAMYLSTKLGGFIDNDLAIKLHTRSKQKLEDYDVWKKVELYSGFEDTAWIVEELKRNLSPHIRQQ